MLAEIPSAGAYVEMVMWEWCCVITATFMCIYFVAQFHPYIVLIIACSNKSAQGMIEVTMEVMTEKKTNKKPAGKGRDEPQHELYY